MTILKKFEGFESWHRPIPTERAFYSPNLDEYLESAAIQIANTKLRELFINTFANTLDTTAYLTYVDEIPETYIITGDIEAMWLRDSSAQVWQYLPLMKSAPEIQELIAGLVRKQSKFIQKDPYANAFYDEDKSGIHASDLTEMKSGVHERKWELDSLCYHLRLSVAYWDLTGDNTPLNQFWIETVALILKTMKIQQRMVDHGPYFFDRVTSNLFDTLSNEGRGSDYSPTGMIASSFRPSDDACTFVFNIPANLFALTVLKDLGRTLNEQGIGEFDLEISRLIKDITRGLEKFGEVEHKVFGRIYAYEVDGLGNSLLMDDANSPSLLSLPYLGATPTTDPIYQATRAFVLSKANPYFHEGSAGVGIGSPHTGENMIWPISLIMQASTSESQDEIRNCLKLLIESSANTGLLHESFDTNNAEKYSRPWFAWCNSLFGQLINEIRLTKPEILLEQP